MEQSESISFSSLVAGVLLLKREVSASELVNLTSRLVYEGIAVEDEFDDLDCLLPCILIDEKYCFSLRNGFTYETNIFPGVSVETFLRQHTTERILSFLARDCTYHELYVQRFTSSVIETSKKEDADLIVQRVQSQDELRIHEKEKRKIREKHEWVKLTKRTWGVIS